ncbi:MULTISPECIES: type II toxin-antitoxin system RelB/DinJ family antitoxin [unclassified Adlercreutzia]|uniref:type II toxin-antitoxin system RelB/DinJ family antitoxin n=1 Tax=unclassified Adlercreutzia TaxID=2636013 RepID=UPI001980BE29|nr:MULTISPECIES: type II toxin-antitoxin system RelB/DinJ family antitoxin [unclassified Adlercreutzia]
MAARNAEVKAYVVPDVKAEAAEVYARWGMSLSDAINVFLVKSIDAGGLPFDTQALSKPRYNPASVLPVDPRWGASVLPADMDDEEDDAYAQLVR